MTPPSRHSRPDYDTTIITPGGSRFVCWQAPDQHDSPRGLAGIVLKPCEHCIHMPDLPPADAIGRMIAGRREGQPVQAPFSTRGVHAIAGADLRPGDWLIVGPDDRVYSAPPSRPPTLPGWVVLHSDEIDYLRNLLEHAVPAPRDSEERRTWEGSGRRYAESLLGQRPRCICPVPLAVARGRVAPVPGCPVHDPGPPGTPPRGVPAVGAGR